MFPLTKLVRTVGGGFRREKVVQTVTWLSDLYGVEYIPSPLVWLAAYTIATTTFEAVISCAVCGAAAIVH